MNLDSNNFIAERDRLVFEAARALEEMKARVFIHGLTYDLKHMENKFEMLMYICPTLKAKRDTRIQRLNPKMEKEKEKKKHDSSTLKSRARVLLVWKVNWTIKSLIMYSFVGFFASRRENLILPGTDTKATCTYIAIPILPHNPIRPLQWWSKRIAILVLVIYIYKLKTWQKEWRINYTQDLPLPK